MRWPDRLDVAPGLAELRRTRMQDRRLYWAVGVFSVFVNALLLTGPLYMLQVYDRVLGSQSEETLLALSLLVVFLFFWMGVLDYLRGLMLTRIGFGFQDRLNERVFLATMRQHAASGRKGQSGLSDLEAIRKALASPAISALFDLPFLPIFLFGIFVFHPALGMLAALGGTVLVTITVLNHWLSRRALAHAQEAETEEHELQKQVEHKVETAIGLGMQDALKTRWLAARNAGAERTILATDRNGFFGATSRTWRLFLQSAMLGLGAWLVLQDRLSPGAMIAASILLGRALAPVEMLVTHWSSIERAIRGWKNLAFLLSATPPTQKRTTLPVPEARLEVEQLTVVPPHARQASLRLVSFRIEPGKALGVIGSSGAGKTTLARTLTGIWPASGGTIRLGSASIDQYEPEKLSQYVGWLPQNVELFHGTIAENIARFRTDATDEAVIGAAKAAAAHEMILCLPDGYDTHVSSATAGLSGGQTQRLGLARALFGDPVLLVLDEPNSNLDHDGSEALNRAIRNMKLAGKSVLIMAHRPAAIKECDQLLMLENGVCRAYGQRDEVLRNVIAQAPREVVGLT